MRRDRLRVKRAIAYCRVSRPEQETGSQSLTMQEERIRAYAPHAGLEIVEVIFEDGVSAGKPLTDRPEGRRLLSRLGDPDIDAFVALRLDRVFRDALDALQTMALFDKMDLAVHFLDFGGTSFDSTSPMGKFMLTVTAAFAEMERMKIGERVRENKASRKKNGKTYAVARFGHVNTTEGKIGSEDYEQSVLKRVHKLRGRGWSYLKIAEALNGAGVPTKQGGRKWYASTVSNIIKRTQLEAQEVV